MLTDRRYLNVYSIDPEFVIPSDSTRFNPEVLKAGLINGARAVENWLSNVVARKLESLATPAFWEA